jgi:GDP-perosamine N-acetyltransferase
VLYGIFGSGGFGREGIWLAEQTCLNLHGSVDAFDLCFIEHAPKQTKVNGHRLMSLREFASLNGVERRFNVLIADRVVRRRIASECEGLGLQPFTIRSPLAEVHPTAVIGEGAVLCQFTFVSANATVGRYFHLNHHGYVSHDCRVGDFVTFAPAVRCNGTIEVGDDVYIGSGVTIHQGTPKRHMRIGHGATVGMGAVVLRSVPDGATVIGNPARQRVD